jgi:dTDP-glucose pyrophosphorylase/CBS domain-containing protein
MKNFTRVLINEHATINEALIKINSNELQAVIVVSNENKIIGTITDGDIRRALIQKISLEAKVSFIMNKEYSFLTLEQKSEDIQDFLEKEDIKFVPILDNGELIDLVFRNQDRTYEAKENPIFIMAGGYGTRLRPLTDNCPKPMLSIGGEPLLELTIKNFKKYGFKNFFISTHYLPNVIKNYFGNGDDFDVNINYIFEENPLGTAGALGLFPKKISKLPIIVINGDIITNTNFNSMLNFHNENFADISIGARNYQYQIPYGVIETNGINVLNISEKPVYDFGVNSGIYILNSDIVEKQKNKYKKDMPQLIEDEILLKKKVLIYKIHNYWRDIGKIGDLDLANKEINEIKF